VEIRRGVPGPEDVEAVVDFEGTGPVLPGNLNANAAIVSSAVLYAFRTLIEEDIPLNGGILEAIRIILPPCLLNPTPAPNPPESPAVAGGNVETSQRIVDAVLGALNVVAAGQGTMNNVTFGNESFGYYETIGGGAGAGEGFHGADAVHVHMTNTRLTDPEILEARYPVRLRRFSIRRGSGGKGKWRGGDGIIREIEFLESVEISLLTQRRKRAPYGKAGGESGLPGRNLFVDREGEVEQLPPICGRKAQAGDVLIIETPGGGGWGAAQDSE
jgi:5-oxoprolinase (ATP-hydrolysing)